MAFGGLIVGALAILHPEVCGNGYSAVNAILHGKWIWQSLALILVFKVVATGASLGYLFGTIFHLAFPAATISPSAFALVGMGAFLAGTTHAPVMAIIMIFELTLDYQIILPLMLACVLAYYTSARVEPRSIYSESLKRKGGGRFSAQLVDVSVSDLMKPDPVAVHTNVGFAEIGQKFLTNRFTYLYVTEGDRRFLGAISLHDIKDFLKDTSIADLVIARDLFQAITSVAAD